MNILSTILQKGTEPEPYIPERLIDEFEKYSGKKIIVLNDKDEDVTDSFIKEDIITKSYLIKSKIYKYKYVDPDYEKKNWIY